MIEITDDIIEFKRLLDRIATNDPTCRQVRYRTSSTVDGMPNWQSKLSEALKLNDYVSSVDLSRYVTLPPSKLNFRNETFANEGAKEFGLLLRDTQHITK